MIKGEYKKILFEVFDVLGFSDTEKEKAIESFKKKLAFELYGLIQGELPQEQRSWIEEFKTSSPLSTDPKVLEIQNTISQLYSQEELHKKLTGILKGVLEDYINFMSSGLEPEKTSRLNDLWKQV